MAYGILMYINGPPNQRRRSHWLYLIAAMMILNLGSKETSFIYIAVFGTFLILYVLVRLAQYFWNLPGKTVFYFLIMGILFSGVASLGTYSLIDIIPVMVLPGRGTPFGDLSALEQSSFILWMLLIALTVITVVVTTAFWAYRDRLDQIRWRDIAIVLLIALIFATGLLILEEFSHTQPTDNQPVAPADPNAQVPEGDTVEVLSTISWLPLIAVWVAGGAILALIVVASRAGWWRRFQEMLEDFPEIDILILIGTLILPWLTAIVPYAMRASTTDYANAADGLPEFVYNFIFNMPSIGTPEQVGQIWLSFLAWLPLMALAIIIGVLWDWKRWLIASAIFHLLFAFFFTTVFTNIAGLATGMVYSLGYWLEQQGVRRGSQPQYYYLMLIMPFYEFLPIVGSVAAMFAGTFVFWRWRKKVTTIQSELDVLIGVDPDPRKRKEDPYDEVNASSVEDAIEEEIDVTLPDDYEYDPLSEPPQVVSDRSDDDMAQEQDDEAAYQEQVSALINQERNLTQLVEIPVLLFFSWWAILNLVGYTLAGEKMPWLGTHLTTPMIFLTAWFFGGIFSRINWPKFFDKGWLLMALLPVLVITLVRIVWPFIGGDRPFAGLQQSQLVATNNWLAFVLISGALIYGIYRLVTFTGWPHLRPNGGAVVVCHPQRANFPFGMDGLVRQL